jgi:hypothetical protein
VPLLCSSRRTSAHGAPTNLQRQPQCHFCAAPEGHVLMELPVACRLNYCATSGTAGRRSSAPPGLQHLVILVASASLDTAQGGVMSAMKPALTSCSTTSTTSLQESVGLSSLSNAVCCRGFRSRFNSFQICEMSSYFHITFVMSTRQYLVKVARCRLLPVLH